MSMATIEPKQELVDRLARRHEADEAGWARIWELMHQTLGRMPFSLYQSVREEKEDLLADFFSEKFLEGEAQFKSFAMLVTAYTNYLTDVYRRERHRPLAEDLVSPGDDEGDAPSLMNQMVAPEQIEEQVSQNKLAVAARDFLFSLDDISRIFVSEGFCDHEGEALYKLAKRHQVASYHKKAADLGILQNKGSLGTDYGDTRIGKWLTRTLQIPIEKERLDEILEAFQALCGAALAWINRMNSENFKNMARPNV